MASREKPKKQAENRVGANVMRIKNMWRQMFSTKKGKTKDKEYHQPQDHSLPEEPPIDISTSLNNVEDIMDKDKDRIRTSCKSCMQDVPDFPSKEEVRKRIEDAHKYYGIKCVYNYYEAIGKSDKQEPLPSWYYILERPLVEQYVIMNNYIRKLSVLASLKNETGDGEPVEKKDEEEVSSISSQSDYSDFPSDSKLIGIYKKNKRERDTENSYGRNEVTSDISSETRPSKKPEVSTITTEDYDIVIRGPENFIEVNNSNTDDVIGETAQRGSAHDLSSEDQLDLMRETALSSGDHLPDMKDFDLSYNLSECAASPPLPGQSYYHWKGNSCPTKTPLLNTDMRPSRLRSPSSSTDFWSFRNFSLSPEYIQMCSECENPPEVKNWRKNTLESTPNIPTHLHKSNAVNHKGPQNKNYKDDSLPETSSDKKDHLVYSVSKIHSDESERGETSSSSCTSIASVDTKISANEDLRKEN